MKSMKSDKKRFCMDDFAKGLMLAGYLMPESIQELKEREGLEQYETLIRAQSSSNIYFHRVVLAAEIVSKLHDEPTLGRIKFQKLVYLCEHSAGMNLAERYQKQTAGPFDNKFMHSVTKEFKKNKWFTETKVESKGITRTKYLPLENCDGYKQYYDKYFAEKHKDIQYIIELFRKSSTDNTELAATIYACFKELGLKNTPVLFNDLLRLFYEWSEKKKRFTETQVRDSINWLCKNTIIDEKDIIT